MNLKILAPQLMTGMPRWLCHNFHIRVPQPQVRAHYQGLSCLELDHRSGKRARTCIPTCTSYAQAAPFTGVVGTRTCAAPFAWVAGMRACSSCKTTPSSLLPYQSAELERLGNSVLHHRMHSSFWRAVKGQPSVSRHAMFENHRKKK